MTPRRIRFAKPTQPDEHGVMNRNSSKAPRVRQVKQKRAWSIPASDRTKQPRKARGPSIQLGVAGVFSSQ
jgi:hypothetical protein